MRRVYLVVHAVANAKNAVVEVVYVSDSGAKAETFLQTAQLGHEADYWMIYQTPLNTDLPTTGHWPGVEITPEDFS